MREFKQTDAELQLGALAVSGSFSGYASIFNIIDSQNDCVLPGAFAKSLAERPGQVKLLWQHQFEEPIGRFTTIREDEKGLYVEGKLLLDVARGREAYALLKEGAIEGLSIGYTPTKYDYDPDSGVRTISEMSLWEISLVTFPANSAAGVLVVKQHSPHEQAEWNKAIRTGQAISLADSLDRAIAALAI